MTRERATLNAVTVWLDRAGIADPGPPPPELYAIVAERDRYRKALEQIQRRCHQRRRDGMAGVAAYNIARRALKDDGSA